MTDPVRAPVRRAVLLAGLALTLAACTDSAPSESADPAPADEATTLVTGGTATPEPAPADTTAPAASAAPAGTVDLVAPDPGPLLSQALAGLAGGYHFATTVQAGDDIALTADGDRIGDNTRLSATSNGETIDYIVTPNGSWAGQNDVWEEVVQETAPSDPVAALAAPLSVTVSGFGLDSATLVATYPPAAFGLTGDTPVEVVIEIVGEQLSALSYGAPGVEPPTTVRTEISPVTDTTPIEAPGS